jgi:hypothetical protein
MDWFSPAQSIGYVAFVLGVAAFLQRVDKRLKLLIASESLVYAVHFALLGNLPASASALISCVRSFLAVKRRPPVWAASIIVVSVAAGAVLVRNGAGWLPIIASCVATLAVFFLRGIPMRLALLSCTLLWLANNIITRSIGGIALESLVAIINLSTIVRMTLGGERSVPRDIQPGNAAL